MLSSHWFDFVSLSFFLLFTFQGFSPELHTLLKCVCFHFVCFFCLCFCPYSLLFNCVYVLGKSVSTLTP